MKRTRRSLFYLAGYLSCGGLGMLLDPDLALRLLFSNGHYGDVMPRFAGVLMLVISAIVVQLIRHRAEGLYATTLGLRVMIVAALAGLYLYSKDPLFLVLAGIVSLGLLMTGGAYLSERKR